jgi:hypothetical protein
MSKMLAMTIVVNTPKPFIIKFLAYFEKAL